MPGLQPLPEALADALRERDEARALVIRAIYPHERDSWRQWCAEVEALDWVQEELDRDTRLPLPNPEHKS